MDGERAIEKKSEPQTRSSSANQMALVQLAYPHGAIVSRSGAGAVDGDVSPAGMAPFLFVLAPNSQGDDQQIMCVDAPNLGDQRSGQSDRTAVQAKKVEDAPSGEQRERKLPRQLTGVSVNSGEKEPPLPPQGLLLSQHMMGAEDSSCRTPEVVNVGHCDSADLVPHKRPRLEIECRASAALPSEADERRKERNRRNQRNFRARQKDKIADLERETSDLKKRVVELQKKNSELKIQNAMIKTFMERMQDAKK